MGGRVARLVRSFAGLIALPQISRVRVESVGGLDSSIAKARHDSAVHTAERPGDGVSGDEDPIATDQLTLAILAQPQQ
jgi:hypothetical protein